MKAIGLYTIFIRTEKTIQNLNPCHLNRLVRIQWEQLILPFQLFFHRVDLLHSPGYTAPIVTHCKKVTTIFDLNYYFHPEDFNNFQLIAYKLLIPLVARRSEMLIVHSKNTKKEFTEVLKIESTRIKVIYPGVGEKFTRRYSKDKIESVLKKYKIKKPYILSNAVSHPHKNLSSLIIAYSRLTFREKNFKHKLVLLGFEGKDQKNIEDLVTRRDLRNRVLFTGWVNPNLVPIFYQEADLFVFPSLYEGFGLPPIEAMASGTPIVASNYSCIPEVIKDSGLLVDSKKPEKLAGAMNKLLKDEKLRNSLVRKARRRVETFSWENFGKEIINVYCNFVDKNAKE
jgi:glycosyltransferase involved in cell wall biosynthesis